MSLIDQLYDASADLTTSMAGLVRVLNASTKDTGGLTQATVQKAANAAADASSALVSLPSQGEVINSQMDNLTTTLGAHIADAGSVWTFRGITFTASATDEAPGGSADQYYLVYQGTSLGKHLVVSEYTPLWQLYSRFGLVRMSEPSAPENFSGKPESDTSIRLVWRSQANLKEYRLGYREAGHSGDFTGVEAPGIRAIATTVPGLTPNTEYEFELTAVNELGAAASTTTALTLPAAPTGLSGQSENTSITVTWDAQSDIGSFKVRRTKKNGSGWLTETVAGNINEKTLTGLSAATEYEIQVCACNAGGESQWASVTLLTLPE